ncbi:DUF3995 domain-containing protein [Streptomyces sp. NPDC048638]|uniref:DUF3995 domain-containing protein n=1 Tax=Streptomyces sp. NPDC048638 TaxID=3365580 RepID=UPI00371DEC98
MGSLCLVPLLLPSGFRRGSSRHSRPGAAADRQNEPTPLMRGWWRMWLRMRSSWHWGYAACLWASVFAGSHFYWAFGGSLGLNVSAGAKLATERPLWFVPAGLWGVGTLCLAGAWLGWLLTRSLPYRAARRIQRYLATASASSCWPGALRWSSSC